MVETSPACQRAVLETIAALEKQGHECIEFTPHLCTISILVLILHPDIPSSRSRNGGVRRTHHS